MSDIKTKARLFVSQNLKQGAIVSPNPDQAHYLMKVMRATNGDSVVVFNGCDGEWRCNIEEATKKNCALRILEQLRVQAPEPDLWLAFAPLKKSNTDFVIEKATELGVSRLIPVFTEHTNTSRVKTERLSAIAMEAAEQCDRLSVPEIAEPVDFNELLANWPDGRILLVPDETGGGQSLKAVLEKLSGDAATSTHGFLIGPEGGFAPSELDDLSKLSFVTRVGLGPRILRAETAALAALSCFQAITGDWELKPRFNNGYFFNARR
ncbi:MAG: 16S rRNA (uracil(1498)-N(3))-methyltransferase [Rhodospirillales bacterium]|nr:16S rRNA (uracil(1498)-N(3))-methyltransferase [Rhodospirillales bacterium]